MTEARPRVLFIVNLPGWGHEFKTANLRRHLEPEFETRRVFDADLTESDLRWSHVVIIHYWMQLKRWPHLRPLLRGRRRRVAIGITSHGELEGARRKPGLRAFASSAGRAFVVSRRLYDTYAPLLDIPVHLTPNGVDTSFFTPRPDPLTPRNRFFVGWAGSLENHGRALRGVDDVLAPAVSRVGAELNLAAREQRWRKPSEMVGFYRWLHVYACASSSEGTPNTCLEAAACGIPIVSTRVGNMPEFIVDGGSGFLVDRDPEGFAHAFDTLRRDPGLREAMGRRARERAIDWDWSVQAENYRTMIRAMLGAAATAGARATTRSTPAPRRPHAAGAAPSH